MEKIGEVVSVNGDYAEVVIKKESAETLVKSRTLAPSNRSDVIRTRDLYVPNVALYQAEPHSAIITKFLVK